MNFQRRHGRDVSGMGIKRGEVVGVRLGDEDLGIGIFDGMACDCVDAVWIVFYGSGPPLISADSDASTSDSLESGSAPDAE